MEGLRPGYERCGNRNAASSLAEWLEQLVAFSPMEPVRRTLMIEDAAQRPAAASYDSGARPSVVLVTDQQLKPESAPAI